METMLERGYRITGTSVNIAAALAANAAVVFAIHNFGALIGTKSFIPRKLFVRNNAGGNLWLTLGTGIPGVAQMPPFRVLNNIDNEWQEFDIPGSEFFASMTAFVDALVAGGSVDIMVEAEIRG